MEKTVKDIDGSTREVEFKFSEEDLKPKFSEAYKAAQPHIEMKGFRKGKVPINVIKKYYGKKIEIETIEELSNETFQNYVVDEKIQMIGTPKLIDMNEDDGGYSFKIQYEIIPNFELAEYKEIEIDEPVHPASEEEIEKELEMVLRNNGDLNDADEVLDDMFIVEAKFQEMDEAANVPIVGKEAQTSKLFLADEYVIPEIKSNLMNAKVGDSFNFKPGQYDEHAPQGLFRITVEKIQKLTPKELTNEFVENYSQGKFKTPDELKEEIGFQIQEKWDEKTKNELETQLINKLVDANDFDVPNSVVQDVINAMGQDIKKRYANLPDSNKLDIGAMSEGLRPLAERTVKWEIIRNKIVEKEQLDIEDSDIEEIINYEHQRSGGDKAAIAAKLKTNKQITDRILSKKVTDLLIDFAVTNEVPFEEYEKNLAHNPEHEHVHDENCDHDHEHDENCNHDHEH